MHDNVAQLRQADIESIRPIRSLVEQFSSCRLTWWPELGIGYYPVEDGFAPYDQDYFDRFDRDAKTDLGRSLMRARCNFVEQHYRGTLVDVGIGSGAFIESRSQQKRMTYGYDINPAGLAWLAERKLFVDPYRLRFEAISMWDVLEHIADFQLLLEGVEDWLFLSLPIFRNAEHASLSKHFRPREHYWYFTRNGLIDVMRMCDFALVSENKMETDLGREDIGTFAFRRI